MTSIRPIAIYLPQYHPIRENNEWWGKGFTEWTNVTKAKPLFDGHNQPHLPADLGFYDLRLPEARQAQAELAAEYGIYGFCYYHYWFNERRILERPFTEVFESGKPDFPFMLCWANENWSRTWDGGENDLLLQQHYSIEDDIAHIRYLIPYFKDSRYIKVDGKPVFVIYKSAELPDAEHTIRVWREEAAKEGLELYICRMNRWTTDNSPEAIKGFDAAIEFQPLGPSFREYIHTHKSPIEIETESPKGFVEKIKQVFSRPTPQKMEIIPQNVFDAEKFIEFDLNYPVPEYKLFPCVSPSWDNTARKKSGYFVFHNTSPSLFKKWIIGKLSRFKPYSKEENFIFVNAWNEWAEGNHMEPCQKWGRGYLESLRDALKMFVSKV